MVKLAQQNYQKIWDTIRVIPQGKIASYGQIADLAGMPGRARLVGRALKELPSNSDIPWFRVLRSSGQIAFPKYSEKALSQKTQLLNDGVEVHKNRVKLSQFQWSPTLDELVFQLKY